MRIVLMLLPLLFVPTASLGSPKAPFVAHEWGTFTTVAGSQGVALEWRPLEGPSDLPTFIYKVSAGSLQRPLPGQKGALRATVRMETPVIYFYSEEERQVSVRIGFPQGRVTEWYPHAPSVNAGIDWGTFTVAAKASSVELPREGAVSHYYPARETEANLVKVCGQGGACQFEKFLFYRGVGNFGLPVTAELVGGTVRVRAAGNAPLGTVFVFERQGDRAGFTQVKAGRDFETPRAALTGSLDTLLRSLEESLVAEGLYRKEAAAMVETWRDHWFEEGLRVFYILPRVATDKILPLTITPAPSELVRVMVGRVELITPKFEARVRADVTRLGAHELAARHGRFAEPALRKIATETSDASLTERILTILEERPAGSGDR
jgi:hypothetical protein